MDIREADGCFSGAMLLCALDRPTLEGAARAVALLHPALEVSLKIFKPLALDHEIARIAVQVPVDDSEEILSVLDPDGMHGESTYPDRGDADTDEYQVCLAFRREADTTGPISWSCATRTMTTTRAGAWHVRWQSTSPTPSAACATLTTIE